MSSTWCYLIFSKFCENKFSVYLVLFLVELIDKIRRLAKFPKIKIKFPKKLLIQKQNVIDNFELKVA